jgi:hypothetical protein
LFFSALNRISTQFFSLGKNGSTCSKDQASWQRGKLVPGLHDEDKPRGINTHLA